MRDLERKENVEVLDYRQVNIFSDSFFFPILSCILFLKQKILQQRKEKEK
jgi:hypothetical protein